MHIDGGLIPFFVIAVVLIIKVTKTLIPAISNHKLRAEQIRADAMVKEAEIQAKNQLELEKLMRQDQANTGTGSMNRDYSVQSDPENTSSRSRVRE